MLNNKRVHNMLKLLLSKLNKGFETMYVYIEESTDYDTITVNVQKMLDLVNGVIEEYEVMDYNISFDGTHFTHGSTSNVVFGREEDCIAFCVKYLMELRDEEGDEITFSEARREVVNNSNGSFKYV